MTWRQWCVLAITVAVISGFVFFQIGGPAQADYHDGRGCGHYLLRRFGCSVRSRSARVATISAKPVALSFQDG